VLRSGDLIADPTGGIRLVFRRTAAETGGAAVVFEAFLEPNGVVPGERVHPRQEQRVDVLAGSLGTRIGGRRTVAGAGARLTVPAGTPHCFWNAGDEIVHAVVEVTPALAFESLVESLFALRAEARAAGRARPALLRRAAVAHAHFATAHAASPPAPVQRLWLALAATLARALGRPVVPSSTSPDGSGSTS
jgi:quercetin dioxygenase-like cupin family protein